MLVLGLVAALVASVLFNVGIVLQALDARAAPRELSNKVGLLAVLFRRPRWVVGWLLGLVGILPQIVAYGDAPFVEVQPILLVGLLLVLVLAHHVLDEHVTFRETAGVLALIAGVALVAWGAPGHVEQHRGAVAVISVVAVLGLGGIAPFLVRGTRFDSGMLVIVAAGLAFGATNIATKLFGDDAGLGPLYQAAVWALVGLALGVAATITNMTAFQRRKATTVVPVSTAVQTFLPIALEPLFLREHWASAAFGGIPLIGGLGVALAGCVLLAGSAAVSGMIAGASTNQAVEDAGR